MAHLQYMPGDPRLVDQLVYELKSKGIFDQFRKECIADVDTRPAYQNLRQRVENSVSTFLARQCWKPDLNKNQLREKLRKHILDGNYLEQGVERIVDQVVNPKVASVFIPQVEDLVYNYLGISRKKATPTAETSNCKVSTEDLLPTDLEAVSPGSVKSNDEKDEPMDTVLEEDVKMDTEENKENKEEVLPIENIEKPKVEDVHTPIVIDDTDSNISIDNSNIPLPTEDIKLENIPAPENSPPKIENEKIELEKIELPKEPNISKEIPLPDQIPLPQDNKQQYFKPIALGSDDDSSSDSSLRRNMSPLTPIRNYNNENSCDAQQGFDNDSDSKSNDKKPCSFRFALESKSTEHSLDGKSEKKDETNLAYQFNNQVNINTFNTPMYEDSSNSNNLQIDYESDANSKYIEKVAEIDHNSEDSKKDKKPEGKKMTHSSSQKSRDSYRHSSSKDKRSDSKQSSSRDSSRHDKKTKDDHSSKSKSSHKERERSSGTSDKKESRDSSKHRSSHKSSSQKDSKSHRSSSSSQRHSSKHSDDKKSSSSNKDKEKKSEKSSKDKRDSKSSSHRSDKDRKSSSSSSRKHDDKDKKKDKKETDDHYSLSGRGNHNRRSTDRDSNDGSSSSKGWNNQPSSKSSETKKESKEPSSKSENTSTSGESTSPSDKEVIINNASDSKTQQKPIRVENHLERPITSPPRLPFVPDVTLKKPKFAANLEEAKKMMRMRKFLDDEQKRMNQEAALLLEFQANVRPSLSQVYSSIPGPELEFACVSNEVNAGHVQTQIYETKSEVLEPANVVANVINDEMVIDEVDETKTTTDAITDENEQNKVVSNHDLNNDNADNSNGDLNNDNADNSNEDLNNDNADNPNEDTLDLGDNGDRDESYNENKPFSQLMDEISERNKNNDAKCENPTEDDNKKRTEYFEITIITEELSEPEEPETKDKPEKTEEAAEEVPEETSEVIETTAEIPESVPEPQKVSNEEYLHYFAEHEKYDAELKLNQHNNFLKAFMEKNAVSDKIYLFNCDTYEENIIKEVASTFGHYEIINYYRNGHLTLPTNFAKNVVNVTLASEITLPVETYQAPTVFSPVKSECSFELSSDYDAKLEEMVNKASRQEIMEIILGSVTDKPTIDYCTESSIDNDVSLKRKFIEAESTENNNMNILTPKVRKLSESDQISSTTEETEETSNNNRVSNSTRSKYLGRARRVGLPRPRRANLPNSPSSDKSVENYEQNTITQPPNGKMKPTTPRNKVQRYDTSDLYKPKLHYLSRRNNIS